MLLNFNSTMVRLKVVNAGREAYGVVGFQFHYGTIKRQNLEIAGKQLSKFQFHYGTIKRRPASAG